MIQTEQKLYEADRKPGPIVKAACWGFKGSLIRMMSAPRLLSTPPVEDLAVLLRLRSWSRGNLILSSARGAERTSGLRRSRAARV